MMQPEWHVCRWAERHEIPIDLEASILKGGLVYNMRLHEDLADKTGGETIDLI